MPSPVTPWVPNQPLTAKSLNLALYTSDGTADNTTGISFAAWRPVLFEAYNSALTLTSSIGGIRTSLAGSGAVTPCQVVFDSAGYFGQSQDLPANGYYQFTPAVFGSSGDGITPGGWYIVAHFAPLSATGTQTAVGADLLKNGTFLSAGTRQQPANGTHGCPFFLDLVNAGTSTFAPALLVDDTGSVASVLQKNIVDSSGETPRFYAIWAGVSATSTGTASFAAAGTYTWTAPPGVTSVTAAGTGGGAGGGGGNSAASFFGGGGGGGGESCSDTFPVTPGNSYPVLAGAGGPGGAAGANGANGGVSSFSGDGASPVSGATSLLAHGGTFGTGATLLANGTGGTGGTGSVNATHFGGGGGAAGSTNAFGGGGGSSAGSTIGGSTATGVTGAPAPPGGGAGGNGGTPQISIIQSKHASVTGTNHLTVTMGSPFQAGSTVVVLMYYQGRVPAGHGGTIPDPTVTLDDITTTLTSQQNADVTSNVSLQNRVFDCYNVSGGQQSVVITCQGTGNDVKAILAEVHEIAGLGASPSIDPASSSHTQGPSNPDVNYQSYSGSPASTTKAPEIWFAMTGAQQTQAFNIHNPPAGQAWQLDRFTPQFAHNGGVFGGMLTAYQFKGSAATLQLTGTFSTGVTKGTIAIAYASGAATTGQAPAFGNGGGGGGGFGANAGGNGAAGQVTLTWASAAGAGYGNPPVPAPLPSWDDTTAASAALVNGSTGIAAVADFLANPPVFRAHAAAAQSIANNPGSPVAVTLGVLDNDTYTGWSSGTSTYTVPRNGLYLAGAMVPFAANATGIRLAGIAVNGTTYWGPACNAVTGDLTCAAKTQIFSLNAGDTVQVTCYQNSGGALSTATAARARLFLAWLGAQGVPSPRPAPPDPGFRWASGTPGAALPDLMTQHLSQDLSFLAQRPYLMAYAGTTQTNLAQNVFTTVALSAQGIVHGDNGDNYGGWTSGASNNYAAVAAGWYLVCGEMFTASGPSGASAIAAVLPSTSGGFAPSTTPDWYQHLTVTSNATIGGGAAIFGLYYLAAGESITPQVQGASFGGTYNTIAGTGLGGSVNSHLEAIWISS